MVRTLGNLFRSSVILAVGGLIGYYSFTAAGWIGIATNVLFFALGIVLVTTWRKKENEEFVQSLETQSLDGVDIPVNAAVDVATIDKQDSTETEEN